MHTRHEIKEKPTLHHQSGRHGVSTHSPKSNTITITQKKKKEEKKEESNYYYYYYYLHTLTGDLIFKHNLSTLLNHTTILTYYKRL